MGSWVEFLPRRVVRETAAGLSGHGVPTLQPPGGTSMAARWGAAPAAGGGERRSWTRRRLLGARDRSGRPAARRGRRRARGPAPQLARPLGRRGALRQLSRRRFRGGQRAGGL